MPTIIRKFEVIVFFVFLFVFQSLNSRQAKNLMYILQTMANLFLCHIFLVFANISHCASTRSLIFFCSYWWRVTETSQRSSHNPIAFVVWGDETLLWRRFVQTNSIVGNGIFLCDSTVHFECDGHHYNVWARFNAVQSNLIPRLIATTIRIYLT